jgi:hypothetical protein
LFVDGDDCVVGGGHVKNQKLASKQKVYSEY